MHRRTLGGLFTAVIVPSLSGATTDQQSRAGDSVADESADRDADPPETADVTFELAPFEIEECGLTCREVTTTIANAGSDDATSVRMEVTVVADGDRIWETDDAIGCLDASDEATRTERVELGFSDAHTVRANDDRVCIETIVDSDQGTDRFVRETAV